MNRLVIFLLILLSGCRVMSVNTADPIVPSVIPVDQPVVMSDTQSLANSAWDDGDNVVRTLAYPHIVFDYSGVTFEGFQDDPDPVEYLLHDGYGFRQRVDWDALWLGDVYGVVNIALDLAVKPSYSDEYESWDSTSTGDIEGWGAAFRDERLDSTIYFSDIGTDQVQTTVTITLYHGEDEPTYQTQTIETDVIALSSPSEAALMLNTENAIPAIGDLESSALFVDWRSWQFGPCALSEDEALDVPSFTRAVDAACIAVENGDYEAAAQALQNALDYTGDTSALRAILRDQLGIIAAIYGRWNVASRHFNEALDLWRIQDNAAAVGRTLHNVGIAYVSGGRWRQGEEALLQAAQLRNQSDDWIGQLLTNGQLGVYWESSDMMRENAAWMRDWGLPQADALEAYLDQFEQSQ